MAPKFNLETADVGMLRERVKQLTTALVKQVSLLLELWGHRYTSRMSHAYVHRVGM